MPTYEYECQRCGNVFERFQNMTEEPVKRCPKCRCKVRRIVGTGAGFIFKGSGFYATDYRSATYTEGAKKEEQKSSEKSSGSGKDSDKSSSEKKSSGKSTGEK